MAPFPEKRFTANWLTAFMVSPGVLFPSAYLALYLSTSAFLNTGFKNELCLSYGIATHNSRSLSIGSLKTGPDLCSVTISDIASMPANTSRNNVYRSINTIEIPLCDIADFLFSKSAREASAIAACEKILAEESRFQ